jgi:hypothetical protein
MAYAQNPPLQASDGNFMAQRSEGELWGTASFYELTAGGTYKVFYNFCNYSDDCPTGTEPTMIVQDAKGNVFGTASFGGVKQLRNHFRNHVDKSILCPAQV